MIAGGTNITVTVCYYATIPCLGNTDEAGIKAQRGAYVTVRITTTVPILTGKLLGLHDFAVSGTSTVLVNN